MNKNVWIPIVAIIAISIGFAGGHYLDIGIKSNQAQNEAPSTVNTHTTASIASDTTTNKTQAIEPVKQVVTSVPGKMIFKCTTANSKQAEIHQTGNAYIYSYGYAGKPEITVQNTISQVEQQSESAPNPRQKTMTFKNGNYTYSVTSGYETMENQSGQIDDVQDFGSIIVEKSSQFISEVQCTKVIHPIEL